MKKVLLSIAILSLGVAAFVAVAGTVASRPAGGPGGKADLTADQRAEIHKKVKALWLDGATREEIRDAVSKLLDEYGVEMPERFGRKLAGGAFGYGPMGRGALGRGGPAALMKDLTNEQRAEVHGKINALWEAGATRPEIRSAVKELLEGYGIEMPAARPGGPGQGRFGKGSPGHGRFGRGGHAFMRALTDEQRAEVRSKRQEMRAEGANREEIHATVKELLESYGVAVPDAGPGSGHGRFGKGPMAHGGFGKGGPAFMDDLTQEQRSEVRKTMDRMWIEGAAPHEIRARIRELVKGYGVDLP